MKPARFLYLRPLTVIETLEMLETLGDDAKVLAGGQSLMALMNMRLASPTHVIDVNQLTELESIDVDGGVLRIGALTRQRTAEMSAVVHDGWLLLAEAIPKIGHVQIRHRGTIGGSLAHADPASELPAVALALDAQLVVRSAAGTRRIPAQDFFKSRYTTALEPTELLVAVEMPASPPGRRVAFEEFSRRRGDFALAAAAIAVDVEDGGIGAARVALAGVASTPVRCADAEERLVGLDVGDETGMAEAAALAAAEVESGEDPDANVGFRRNLVRVLVERALRRAFS